MRPIQSFAVVALSVLLVQYGCEEGPKYHPKDGGAGGSGADAGLAGSSPGGRGGGAGDPSSGGEVGTGGPSGSGVAGDPGGPGGFTSSGGAAGSLGLAGTGGGGSGKGGASADCPSDMQVCKAPGAASTCIPMGACCASSDCSGPCQVCSASHACVAAMSQDDPSGHCKGTCDAAGTCKSKKGQTCQTTPGGCVAGTSCAPDGYCCDQACDASCMACDLLGFEGTCKAVASGPPHGNRAKCAGASAPCAGSCAGRSDGQCDYPTVACGGGAMCSGTKFVGPSMCSGGACMTSAAADCPGALICSVNACKVTCGGDSDCLPTYACTAGSCLRKAGSVLWARSMSTVFIEGLAEGPAGVIVTGGLTSAANLGGTILTPTGQGDGVIAEYAIADGKHLHSNRFGGGSPAGSGVIYPYVDVLDSTGAPFVEGITYCDSAGSPACSKIDVGSGPVAPGGGATADGFVGRYSDATGVPTWTKRLAGPGDDKLVSVANGPSGTIFVAGWYDQTTTLIGGNDSRMFTGAGDRDVLIAQLNATTGAIGMTKTFAGPGFEQPSGIAWTGTRIIASGFFAGTTVFGSISLSSMDFDVWAASLMPDGTPVWAVRLGGAGPDKYPFMVVDGNGDVYLSGTVSGSAMFGSYNVGGAGGVDGFVVKLSGIDGKVIWATSFGSAGDDSPEDIAISRSGQIVVVGTVAGPISVGGPFAGGSDAAILSYNSNGTLLWAKVIGTSGTDYGFSVANGTDSFYAGVNLGADIGSSVEGVAIQGAAAPTGLVLKLQP